MLKKIIIGFIVLLVLLIGAIIAIPFIFKDEINAKIKEQINKELLADVDYTSYDLSIIRSFPDLYFTLNDLNIVGREAFENDTLANIKQIGIGLELMKLIRGEELQINSILIDEANVLVYSIVTETGDTIANYDILPPTDSEEDTSDLIAINLNNLVIKNSNVFFADVSTGYKIAVENINTEADIKYIDEAAKVIAELTLGLVELNEVGTGMNLKFNEFKTTANIDYTETFATVITNLDFNSLSFNDGSMQMLSNAKVVADLNIDADLENSVYTLKENTIAINALKLFADGVVGLPNENTTTVDLKFNANKSSFKELLSLIPAEYLKDIEGAKVDGNFTFNGYAKGNITETETPAFDVNLSIENGKIQYPDLPSAIDKINLAANFKNSTSNLEATNVSIPNASFNVVGQDILMSLFAQNALGDPLVDLKVKGSLPLNKVPEFYPLEGVNKITGNLDADITFKGLLSDVENEKFNNVDFGGNLNIANLIYDAIDLPMPVSIELVQLDFSPQKANLLAKNVVLGKSDFNITGGVENIINYVLADGTIDGKLDIKSNNINLDEIMGSEESAETTTTETTMEESSIIKIPANITFVGNFAANNIDYDGLKMSNVKGGLKVEDESLYLTNLSANMLGGSAKINGSYITKNVEKPLVEFAWDIEKFDIQQTFNQFNTVQAIAPIAKYLTGTFSTDMKLNSVLNNDLSLDLSMLSGLGNVKIPYASFTDMPIFQKIADVTKISAIKKPELNNAWTVLKFEDGKVNVEPFQIKMQDMVMNIEGSNGFDQSIAYVMNMTVPSDKFGGAATIANNFLSKQNIPLLNLSVPQSLTFGLNVGGTITKPSVSIGKVTADGSDKGLKDQIKDNAKEQLENVKETVKEEAKEQINNVKEEAKEQLNNTKEEIKDNIKQETENAKEDIKNNIKDKFKGWGK